MIKIPTIFEGQKLGPNSSGGFSRGTYDCERLSTRITHSATFRGASSLDGMELKETKKFEFEWKEWDRMCDQIEAIRLNM